MANHRMGRISEEIKRELGSLIPELKDPRISGIVSVVSVDVSRDLGVAKVFVSVLGTDEQRSNTLAGISSASGFIRKEIGRRVKLRRTPEFAFVEDTSIEYGSHINKLIGEVLTKDNKEEDEI